MYICDCSRSLGAGSAMCLNTRGLVRSVIRRIVPPLPAESRPSNTMHTLAPVALTHSCIATSSPCRISISASYSARFILRGAPSADESIAVASPPCFECFECFDFFDFLAMAPSPRSSSFHRTGVADPSPRLSHGWRGQRPVLSRMTERPGSVRARRCRQPLGGALEMASTRSPMVVSGMARAMSAWLSMPTRTLPSMTGSRRTA